ncbi:MAG: prepilin-type N-terminal cleavage/methylation domain-containing protein [Candidatus Uhrbacteria bacterium]|nr:prepilin-type N-terminal cleavage/methylation domain-containing protein [Candidatus Uhrbacteria bacterium]
MKKAICARRISQGFTLLEMMLGISLSVLLLTTAVWALSNQVVRLSSMRETREAVRHELEFARDDTISGTRDANWGVAFFPHLIVRFQGDGYAARVSGFDRATTIDPSITLSGASEINFRRPEGVPTASGTVMIKIDSQTAVITVNEAGMVEAP